MNKTKIDAQLQSLIAEACEVLKSQSTAARQLGSQIDKGTAEIIDYLDQVAELYADRQAQIAKRMNQIANLVHEATAPPQWQLVDLPSETTESVPGDRLDQVRRRPQQLGVSAERVNSAMSSLQLPKRYAAV